MRFNVHDTSRNVRTSSTSRKTPCPWILKTPKIDSGRQERQLPYEPPEELELRLGALSFDNHRTSWASSASADGHLYLRSPAGYPFSRARGAVMMPFFEWYIYDGLYVVNAKPAKQTSIFFVGFLNLKIPEAHFLFSSWDRALVMPSLICWPPFEGLMIAPLHLENLAIARRVSLLQLRSSSRLRRLGAFFKDRLLKSKECLISLPPFHPLSFLCLLVLVF